MLRSAPGGVKKHPTSASATGCRVTGLLSLRPQLSGAPYDELDAALRTIDEADVRLSAFPDGSVDTRYTLAHGGEVVASRKRLGECLASGEFASFSLKDREEAPGGQMPNTAIQADALGAGTWLAGHPDHGVFDDLPFRTASMGDPAAVTVFELQGGDVMFVAESADIREWTFEDLTAAVPDDFFAADAVCAGNWVSVPRMPEALRQVPDRLDADTVLFDPGKLAGYDPTAIRSLAGDLKGITAEAETALRVSREEFEALAGAFDADGEREDDAARARELREVTDVVVVLHAVDAALAATGGGIVRVPNVEVESTVRQAGAGDRFNGGLAAARGAGLDWETALACGNACASHYVATGETGDRKALRDFLAAEALS
jgi:sugar/nucleoside kinase (ribokinase family)